MGCTKSQPKAAISPLLPPSPQLQITATSFVRENSSRFNSVYKLGNVLGAGAFADVRRCEHRITGSIRAVKIIDKAALKGAGQEEKLLHEFKILRGLDHPHIVRLYEVFEEPSLYYIIMEYCRGGELFSLIKTQKHISEPKAAHVMHQLFAVVSYLHEQRIVHRDLKPENIFLEQRSGEMSVKIGDFGLAERLNERGFVSGVFGTSYYMAPEVFEAEYSTGVDVWSCGVILYIMLSGKVPFPGNTDEAIIERVKALSYTFELSEFAEISEEAKDLISKTLCPPGLRITAREALQHPWFKTISYEAPSSEMITGVLKNLRSFKKQLRIKDALQTFIATQLTTSKEAMVLQEVFRALDTDADGRISKEDLVFELSKTVEHTGCDEEAEMIIAEVANDRYIGYTEFLRAGLDPKTLLSRKNLELAFHMIDEDGSGMISANDLKMVLSHGQSVGDEVWSELIAEADTNGDGKIDIEDFKAVLLSKI